MIVFSYLEFVEVPMDLSRKTKVYQVENVAGVLLGRITWFADWRRYVYQSLPDSMVTLDVNCMSEIVVFINRLMEAQKVSA